ncbi:MAG: class I SAM-dependent methyltransferase [Chloroflexi bacterium]|nr:class I SAM-dependent methyltransferase [Chloroflexota bacterium]
MDMQAHWSRVYQTKAADDVSWYQATPRVSLDLLRRTGATPASRLIDVGAGASTLVDHLLANGYATVTLLDIAPEALDAVRARLGERAASVTFIAGDVTRITLPADAYDVWHDRAVFHFLRDPAQRAAYVESARRALKPGGVVIMATFALDGPQQCSGLDVMRYDAAGLQREFGPQFDLVESMDETHRTPWGGEQQFVYCVLRRVES